MTTRNPIFWMNQVDLGYYINKNLCEHCDSVRCQLKNACDPFTMNRLLAVSTQSLWSQLTKDSQRYELASCLVYLPLNPIACNRQFQNFKIHLITSGTDIFLDTSCWLQWLYIHVCGATTAIRIRGPKTVSKKVLSSAYALWEVRDFVLELRF